MNSNLERIYAEYSQKFKDFATDFANSLTPKTREEFRVLLEGQYDKELKEAQQYELYLIKAKNRLYSKLLHSQSKLSKKEKATQWYERLFERFQHKGLLEDLLKATMLHMGISVYVLEAEESATELQDDFDEEVDVETETSEESATEPPAETSAAPSEPEQGETPPPEEPAAEQTTEAENAKPAGYWQNRRRSRNKKESAAQDVEVAEGANEQPTASLKREEVSDD